ncbi:toxin-activating lysine-acyltransferase [Pseudomonas fluorescens]|nr:toxin-activating lysine-acyltransferase [Pseudomonas fluorescens]
MKNKFDLFTECKSIAIKDKAMLLGYANMIIFKCQAYSVFRIITLDFWISPAIEHRQIIFLFDSTTKPIGYITWAHLAPDAEHRLLKDPSFLLHPSEWNEGGANLDY